MKSKTATGRAAVVPGPDECRCIHWESFLEAQRPPSRKGEKPSDSCSAKRCGHPGEFCTCPSGVSLPTATSQLSSFSLRTRSRLSAHAGVFYQGTPSAALTNQNSSLFFLHKARFWSWLAPPHLQITIFWVACMHVGRADDKAEGACLLLFNSSAPGTHVHPRSKPSAKQRYQHLAPREFHSSSARGISLLLRETCGSLRRSRGSANISLSGKASLSHRTPPPFPVGSHSLPNPSHPSIMPIQLFTEPQGESAKGADPAKNKITSQKETRKKKKTH